MSKRITAKMMHDPVMELKKSALDDENREITKNTVNRLYNFEDENN
jgi:glutamyl-tRNA reductase